MIEAIYSIVDNSIEHYLGETLWKTPEEQHEEAERIHGENVRVIAEYCSTHLYNAPKITIKAIQWLHKILYPEGHRTYIDMKPYGKVLYLVPGNFKTINNKGFDSERWQEFEFTPPHQVKSQMEELLLRFEQNISDTTKSKKDTIFSFILDFSEIHPFADGNGRVAVILLDLLLVKHGLGPVSLNKIKEKYMEELYKGARHYDLTKKLDKFYEVIDRYYTL